MTFAEALKRMREELNLTQELLAQSLKVSFPTVNKWENNKTKPLRIIRNQIVEYAKSKDVSAEIIAVLANA
jgi:Predicted transcriptional regulators